MSYDAWKTRVPDDRDSNRPEDDEPVFICADCGEGIYVGEVIREYDQTIICGGCFNQREAHGKDAA